VSIAIVGINHRTVPLEVLEPLIVAPADTAKALADLASRPHLDEVVVLSTCMRTEVYAVVNRFHGAMADIREFMATWGGRPPEEFSGSLYSYFDEAAISHLFRVACGLDSASLGEPEVLGQVRVAADIARREGTSGPLLGAAFRHAIQVGKRARTETAISRGTTSLSHAAVALAAQRLGGLEGKQALVLGVGEVGEVAARAFSEVAGMRPLVVANRTRTRAERLAAAVGSRSLAWDEVPRALAEADVVACCTAAESAVVGVGYLARAMAQRRGRPILLVDLAVPRNVDPAVVGLDGVTLLDMDDISAFVADQFGERRAEVPAVERIVTEEIDRYNSSLAARSVAPLVSALHDRAEEVCRAELGRLEGRLGPLSADQQEAIELMARRIVAKILHEPTVNLKAAAGTAKGEPMAEAFRDIFGLEP
jgi:glutamyl-tRNA reductase